MDELIKKYANEIERIVLARTFGDYTWYGLLAAFAQEVEENGCSGDARKG
jgi:hypothetical protein